MQYHFTGIQMHRRTAGFLESNSENRMSLVSPKESLAGALVNFPDGRPVRLIAGAPDGPLSGGSVQPRSPAFHGLRHRALI
jgi:hypothetical protein